LTEQNRALVQSMYAAATRGDAESLMSLLADDVVVHEPDYLPYGAEYVGKEAFAGLFGKISQLLDLTDVKLDYLVADNDRVIGVLRIPDRNTGKDTLFAEQSTIRDGKIVDLRIFYYDAQSMIGAPKI
jgi:hypothetical protein